MYNQQYQYPSDPRYPPTSRGRRDQDMRNQDYYSDGGDCGDCDDCCAPLTCGCPQRQLLWILITVITLGAVLGCVSFFTPYMLSADGSVNLVGVGTVSGDLYFGIFTACGGIMTTLGSTSDCGRLIDIDGVPDWLEACQALAIIGVSMNFVAWGLAIGWLCCLHRRNMWLKMVIVVGLLVGVVCLIVSLALFAAEWEDSNLTDATVDQLLDYDWSFYLGWVSIAILLVALIVSFLVPANSDPMEPQMAYAYGQPVGQQPPRYQQQAPYQPKYPRAQPQYNLGYNASTLPMKPYPNQYNQGYSTPGYGKGYGYGNGYTTTGGYARSGGYNHSRY